MCAKLEETDKELRAKENDKAIIVLGEGQYASIGGGIARASTAASLSPEDANDAVSQADEGEE